MGDFDLTRLRANWNRAAACAATRPSQAPAVAAPTAENGPCRGAPAIVEELSRLIAGPQREQYPALGLVLGAARECAQSLSTAQPGAERAKAATRLLDLAEQLEDLLEVYGGMGIR